MFPPNAPPLPDLLTEMWQPRIWAFVVALLVSLLATPLFRWIALRKDIWDQPDQAVKIHAHPVPYLGGCAIWLAWTVGFLFALVLTRLTDPSVVWDWHYLLPRLALVLGGAVAFVTGLLDDLFDIQHWQKLLGQSLAAVVLLAGGIRWMAYPNLTWLPFLDLAEGSLFVVMICVAIHFVVVLGATNATNLLDGLDGLCSGVTVIISAGFLLLATALVAWADPVFGAPGVAIRYEYTQPIMSMAFALAGATIGFLPYNFNPARIFMGDAGSVFIGYVLAAMMIMFASRHGIVKWFIGALFIFGVPIFDTGVAVIRRVLNHRPIMRPDRSHVYNQLVDRLGLSVRWTVAILYGMSILFAAAGLLVLYLPGTRALLIYLGAGAAILVVVWRLGFLRMTPEEIAAADRSLAQKRRM